MIRNETAESKGPSRLEFPLDSPEVLLVNEKERIPEIEPSLKRVSLLISIRFANVSSWRYCMVVSLIHYAHRFFQLESTV